MASNIVSPKSNNLLGKNYEIFLNKSIEEVSASLQNPNSSNSSILTSNFQKIIQSKSDTPLQAIWAFTSLKYSDLSSSKIEPSNQIKAIKELFQLLVSVSASCNSIKSIAIVAPVLYKLHDFILQVKGLQLGPKRERKVNGEIEALVDSILGYLNVCCEGFDNNFDGLEGLVTPLENLIGFQMVDNKLLESLRAFFPLLSDGIVMRVSVEGCKVIELACFVVAEAVLLKLCWKIREEGFGEKMHNELKSWLIGSVTAFRSSCIYVSLLSMLLEPALPITSIVNPEYENGLRKVLFDALLLVEYSFLSSESLGKLPAKHAKRVIFTKLMVTHEAVKLFRGHGDQAKTIPYLNAFSSSSLPSQIIKCVRREIGNELSGNGPNGSSPIAFLRWMLNIENMGIKIFEDDMSNVRSKLISDFSKEDSEKLASLEERKKLDTDMFYIDNKGQEENDENAQTSQSMSVAFMTAANSMQSSEQGKKRKTKDGKKREKVKFVKYELSEKSSEIPRNDDANNGSEIDSDEE